MAVQLNTVDGVEILTLQDNMIDVIPKDNNTIITRAQLVGEDMNVKGSLLAEHGFSCLISITKGSETRQLLFDFGQSPFGAAYNADLLGVDLTGVEVLALSHGHLDHIGGLLSLAEQIGRNPIDLVLHPAAKRQGRGPRINKDVRIWTPSLDLEGAAAAGINLVETKQPMPLLDGYALFLGEIPRKNDFEKAEPHRVYDRDGEERFDDLSDDTSLLFHVRDKGLVLISGCAHAGIVNSLTHAVAVTGENRILAVMGGFHLSGRDELIAPTLEGLKSFDPAYVVPTHCTGRNAINRIEAEMGEQFLFNMSGTTMRFSVD